ncbi:hypothetical protein ACFL2D_02480 [Patescibacteria group bacterium]
MMNLSALDLLNVLEAKQFCTVREVQTRLNAWRVDQKQLSEKDVADTLCRLARKDLVYVTCTFVGLEIGDIAVRLHSPIELLFREKERDALRMQKRITKVDVLEAMSHEPMTDEEICEIVRRNTNNYIVKVRHIRRMLDKLYLRGLIDRQYMSSRYLEECIKAHKRPTIRFSLMSTPKLLLWSPKVRPN